MMMVNITEHDRHLFMEALKDIEVDHKKIGEQNVESLLVKFKQFYDKMVREDFKYLDTFFNVLMKKKNFLTFIFKCAFSNVMQDCQKDLNKLKEDGEGKYWAFLYDDIEAKFKDTTTDFENFDKTVAVVDAMIDGKSLDDILKMPAK